jgi:predicted nuclease of predicted toxin-antitoxin system
VNILLDECVPARLGRSLLGHSVITVQRRGWAGIKNGDLLALAEKEFNVFVTVDRKIAIEQDLTRFHAGRNPTSRTDKSARTNSTAGSSAAGTT